MGFPGASDLPRNRQELEAFLRQRLGEHERVAIQRIQSTGAAPTGAAGGVLNGSYPNPGFANDMATQAELNAHAADSTAVHGIADTADLVLASETRYEETFGNGALTSINIDHGFGTKDVHWQVYEVSSGIDVPIGAVLTQVARTTANRIVLTFAAAPTLNQYRIVVRR